MVLIFAKARICRGNMQVHLQFFCKPKRQLTQKGPAAAQMDCSSASSKILFHGLPSKSKRPSIRKHSIVVIITVNSTSFYEIVICREIFRKYFLASIFVNFQKILAAHQNTFRKVLKTSQKYTRGKVLRQQSCRLLQEQPPDAFCKRGFLRKVFAKFIGKGLRQRLDFNKVAFLRL